MVFIILLVWWNKWKCHLWIYIVRIEWTYHADVQNYHLLIEEWNETHETLVCSGSFLSGVLMWSLVHCYRFTNFRVEILTYNVKLIIVNTLGFTINFFFHLMWYFQCCIQELKIVVLMNFLPLFHNCNIILWFIGSNVAFS